MKGDMSVQETAASSLTCGLHIWIQDSWILYFPPGLLALDPNTNFPFRTPTIFGIVAAFQS